MIPNAPQHRYYIRLHTLQNYLQNYLLPQDVDTCTSFSPLIVSRCFTDSPRQKSRSPHTTKSKWLEHVYCPQLYTKALNILQNIHIVKTQVYGPKAPHPNILTGKTGQESVNAKSHPRQMPTNGGLFKPRRAMPRG